MRINTLKKIFLASVIGIWILHAGFIFLFRLTFGKDIHLTTTLSGSFIMALIYSLVYVGLLSVSLKPRFNYLDSDETKEPVFRDQHEKIINMKDNRIDLRNFSNQIDKNWIITFSNEAEGVIKLRSQISMSNWGAGVFLKHDTENKTVKIVGFPVIGYTKRGVKLAFNMMNRIEELLTL